MWSTNDIIVATITDLRNRTTDIAEAIRSGKKRVVITKNDSPIGAFVPYEDFTRYVEGNPSPPAPDAKRANEAIQRLREFAEEENWHMNGDEEEAPDLENTLQESTNDSGKAGA